RIEEAPMELRKTLVIDEEVRSENGARLAAPLRRVAAGAVLKNPLCGQPVGSDLKPLIDISVALGEQLSARALALLGAPNGLRAYGKAALVGIAGDLEHGAAMIHPRLGMAMRQAIRRGRVLIPGNA